MAAATDYLRRIVDERTNWSYIKSTFDIFSFDNFLLSIFFLPNLCRLFHLFIIKKNLKIHKIYFNKILIFLCELRNHAV
jgi:hypothetical protein